jgi:hypothetical protein
VRHQQATCDRFVCALHRQQQHTAAATIPLGDVGGDGDPADRPDATPETARFLLSLCPGAL